MIRLTLKAIKMNADFRKASSTTYEELVKAKHFPGPPRKGECYLLVSKSGNQMVWILNVTNVTGKSFTPTKMYDTRRWRLKGGTWSHHMLENYANSVGITLVGRKRLEDAWASR